MCQDMEFVIIILVRDVSTMGGGISHVCQGHMILACNVSGYGVVIIILVLLCQQWVEVYHTCVRGT